MAPSIPTARDILLTAVVIPIFTARAALPVTGNITLFSDTKCQEPVFVNNAIVGRDFCAHSESADDYLGAFGSFILNERPWCDDGSVPWWNVFTDGLCAVPAASFEPGSDADGTCVAVEERGFKSYSFVCEDADRDSDDDGAEGDADSDDDYDVEPTTSADFAFTTLPFETAEPTLRRATTSESSTSETSTVKPSTEATPSTAKPPTESSGISSSPAQASSQSMAPTSAAPVSTPEPTGGVGTLNPNQSFVIGFITIMAGSLLLSL